MKGPVVNNNANVDAVANGNAKNGSDSNGGNNKTILVANPLVGISQALEKKLRNLEKRRSKLQQVKQEKESGNTLTEEQLDAISKAPEVDQQVEYFKDLHKTVEQQARRYQTELKRTQEARDRTNCVNNFKLFVQYQELVKVFGQKNAREVLLENEGSDLPKLTVAEFDSLEKLSAELFIPAEQFESVNDWEVHLQKAGEIMQKIVAGTKHSIIGDFNGARLKSLFNELLKAELVRLARNIPNGSAANNQNDGNNTDVSSLNDFRQESPVQNVVEHSHVNENQLPVTAADHQTLAAPTVADQHNVAEGVNAGTELDTAAFAAKEEHPAGASATVQYNSSSEFSASPEEMFNGTAGESNAPVTAVAESSVKESEDVAPAVETSEGGAPQANTGENKPDSTVVNGNNGRNAPHQNNRRFNNRRFNNNTGGQQQGFNGPHRNNYRNNSFRRYNNNGGQPSGQQAPVENGEGSNKSADGFIRAGPRRRHDNNIHQNQYSRYGSGENNGHPGENRDRTEGQNGSGRPNNYRRSSSGGAASAAPAVLTTGGEQQSNVVAVVNEDGGDGNAQHQVRPNQPPRFKGPRNNYNNQSNGGPPRYANNRNYSNNAGVGGEERKPRYRQPNGCGFHFAE